MKSDKIFKGMLWLEEGKYARCRIQDLFNVTFNVHLMYNNVLAGHAITPAVICRLSKMWSLFRSEVRSCEICG
jgi:hypothetical protein